VFIFGLALMILAIYRPQGLLPPRRTVQAKRLAKELGEDHAEAEGEEIRHV
jgi:branched-chain amino acid transport system permease protein